MSADLVRLGSMVAPSSELALQTSPFKSCQCRLIICSSIPNRTPCGWTRHNNLEHLCRTVVNMLLPTHNKHVLQLSTDTQTAFNAMTESCLTGVSTVRTSCLFLPHFRKQSKSNFSTHMHKRTFALGLMLVYLTLGRPWMDADLSRTLPSL